MCQHEGSPKGIPRVLSTCSSLMFLLFSFSLSRARACAKTTRISSENQHRRRATESKPLYNPALKEGFRAGITGYFSPFCTFRKNRNLTFLHIPDRKGDIKAAGALVLLQQ